MSNDEADDPLLESTIKELWKLARGDFDLVEEAVVGCLEEKRNGLFKPNSWHVNIEKAMKYIIDRRKALEAIQPADQVDD